MCWTFEILNYNKKHKQDNSFYFTQTNTKLKNVFCQSHLCLNNIIICVYTFNILHVHKFNVYLFEFSKNGISNCQIIRPDCHVGVLKKRKVVTKTISYKRYGEILFQKVASGYLLHFVQDGPSKNVLDNYLLRKHKKKHINIRGGKRIYPRHNSRSSAP